MFYISYKLDHAHVLYFLWGQRLVFLIHLQVVSKNADQYVVTDTGNTFLWINYEPRGLKVYRNFISSEGVFSYQTEP